MKKLILTVFLILLLAACAPTATQPTATQPAPTAQPTAQPPAPETTYDQSAAAPLIAAAADALGVSKDQIIFVSMEAAEWSDGCLGLGGPAESCLAVITPGFKVTLQGPDGPIVFHTNQTMDYFRMETNPVISSAGDILVTWHRSGGIAGICQNMDITKTGTYYLANCAGGDVLQGQVPDADFQYLLAQAQQYARYDWAFEPPAGSADMFIDIYSLAGSGTQTPSTQEQEQFNSWLAELAARLRLLPGSATVSDPNPKSGIILTTLIGPTCGGPVTAGDTTCLDKPYPAEIEILNSLGGLVKTVQTGESGTITVSLAPGEYLLNPKLSGRFPSAQPQTVLVSPIRLVEVTIIYDSGMR